MALARLRVSAVFVVGVVLLASCGFGGPSRIELIRENPLANPTLSFTEPAGQTSVEGEPAGLIGGPAQTIHFTLFNIDPADAERAFQELTLQAADAGFQLERISSEGRLPDGRWLGRDPGGIEMTLLIVGDGVSVRLR